MPCSWGKTVKIGKETFEAAARTLKEAQRLWLTTHVKSDGDGIGCELALLRFLEGQGKEVRVINDTAVPPSLAFLLKRPGEIEVYDGKSHDRFLRTADAIVVLDVGLTYRLGRLEPFFLESRAAKVCLDHHTECDNAFHHLLSDTATGSTGEILAQLLKALDARLTPDIATPLFAAVAIDTGSFAYERCTPETFHLAARLVEAGAEPYAVHRGLHWNRRMDEVKLEGEVIQNLRLDGTGAIAYSEVTRDMLGRYGIDPMEMPAVVNVPLSVEGVEIALLFVEAEPCTVHVSARSKGKVPVHTLARKFGGGGHPLAAGFSLQGPLEEAKVKVLGEARTLLGRPARLCETG
jgi:phosphoesterase RecJ-like protein